MSRRTVTDREMSSRVRRSKAAVEVWKAVLKVTETDGELTSLEWLAVFNELTGRLVAVGLKEEFAGVVDPNASPDDDDLDDPEIPEDD